MQLRSMFKMRMSILNTATTEQMGYIIFSFFVYTKSTNQYFGKTNPKFSESKLHNAKLQNAILITILFFFIIVFLQFSIKFYFSGCLVLIINSKLMIFVGKRREFPILTNCRFRIARKKKKIIHPRCGFGACLRCSFAS